MVALWLLVSIWAPLAGWSLSALHRLDRVGWICAVLALMAGLWGLQKAGWLRLAQPGAKRIRWRRFGQPLPGLFLGVAVISLIGGALAPPNNYDGLTYRLPRTLHWMAEKQWHWISTPEARMNFSGTGFEWPQTALFSLTNSDRCLFLLNWIPFLLLPGLIFAVLRGFGCAGRVARFWMWFLPLTYGIALQSGSIANDAFACFYVLAAFHFALAAQKHQRTAELCLSILAAAFLTSIKASNLPLLLPIAIALWPVRKLMLRRIVPTTFVAAIGIAISFVPIAIANQVHAGHWTGDAQNSQGMRLNKPVAGFIGNAMMLAIQSAAPPVLPPAQHLTGLINENLPPLYQDRMHGNYPRFAIVLTELPQEESSGVGLGCTLLTAAALAATAFRPGTVRTWFRGSNPAQRLGLWVAAGSGFALLFYMTKMGSEYPARILTPYYPGLILFIALPPGMDQLVRQRWWSAVAWLSAASTLCVLLISPAHPTLPMERLVGAALQRRPDSKLLQRAQSVYATYRSRHDMLGPLRQHIPGQVQRIGLCGGGDESEVALWRPYGQRRVERLSWEELFGQDWRQLEWVAVKVGGAAENQTDLETHLRQLGVTIVAREQITSKLARGPESWLVLQLPAGTEKAR
jgi:hypothetical protein